MNYNQKPVYIDTLKHSLTVILFPCKAPVKLQPKKVLKYYFSNKRNINFAIDGIQNFKAMDWFPRYTIAFLHKEQSYWK